MKEKRSITKPRGNQPHWGLLLIAFFVLSFLAFGSVLPGEFVVDDKLWASQATKAGELQSNVQAQQSIYLMFQAWIFRPLHALFISFLQPALGIHVAAWHVVSILLHAFNGFLLYLTLEKFLPQLDWKFRFGAPLLFLLHPAGSEAVFWISAMSELTATLAMLTTLLLYLRWRSAWTPARCLMLGASAMAACLFKETAIMLAPAILSLELLLGGRTATTFNTRLRWGPAIAVTIAAILFLVMRTIALKSVSGGQPLQFNAWRLAELGLAHLRFLWLPAAPPFALRPPEVSLFSPFTLSVALILLLGTASLSARSKATRPIMLFGLIWGALALWPAYAVALVGEGFFNGRQAYIASLGIPLIFGAWLSHMAPHKKMLASVLLFIALCWMVATTAMSGTVWRSNLEVYRQAMQVSPKADGPRVGVAMELENQGKIAEAIALYSNLIERARTPKDKATYLYNMASLLGQNGRGAESEVLLYELIQLQPNDSPAWTGLGNIAWSSGRLEAAESHYRRALEIDPRNQEAATNLSRLRARLEGRK